MTTYDTAAGGDADSFERARPLWRTLASGIEGGACAGTGVTFIERGRLTRSTWQEIYDDARSMAASLSGRGVVAGDRVAVLGRTTRSVVTAIEATILCGATLVMLPVFPRLSIEESIDRLGRILSSSRAVAVLADEDFVGLVRQAWSGPSYEIGELEHRRREGPPSPVAAPDDLAVLQFTSGSTRFPRAVRLSHRNLCHNVQAVGHRAALQSGQDTVLSWLPLFHDMGLIGFLFTPMMLGLEAALASPELFMERPRSWLEWTSELRATVIGGPDFGYSMAARQIDPAGGRLDQVRVMFNGSEPVDPAVTASLAEGARGRGLDASAMYPVYGLAEATLAVTVPEPKSGTRTVHPGAADHRCSDECVVCGRVLLGTPVPGMEVRIRQPQASGAGGVGEIEVRGESVSSGYDDDEDDNSRTADGWHRTGDLGALVDNELVVCGRSKDLIIIAGRNIWPQDIETVCAGVPGIRPGNVAAFEVERSPHRSIVVVAETNGIADGSVVRDNIRAAIVQQVSASVHEVVLVPPRTIPKTSSGKVQRGACRDRYLAGEYSDE